MKIISKFKDFYDHKIAKYGEDPLLLFDRRKQAGEPLLHSLPAPLPEWQQRYGACVSVSVLFVGDLHVFLFNTGDKVYTSYDVAEVTGKFDEVRDSRTGYRCAEYRVKIRFHDGSICTVPQLSDYRHAPPPDLQAARKRGSEYDGRDISAYRRAPLLLLTEEPSDLRTRTIYAYANPQLSALGIYLDADLVWQKITEYLSQLKTEAETSPPMTNSDKIASKGFDGKRSFRPKMKK